MDDVFESNNTFETATNIVLGQSYLDLASCNEDFYRFQLPAKTVGIISIRRLDEGGKLELTTYDAQGAELNSVSTGEALEAISVGPFGDERTITVGVSQTLWSGGRYSLLTEALEIENDSCVDDANELGMGDDTIETGRLVRSENSRFPTSIEGRACANDAGFTCFHLNQGEHLNAHVSLTSGSPRIAGTLYGQSGESLATAYWARGISQDLEFEVVDAGRYCLGLVTEAGEGVYSLSLSAWTDAMAERCNVETEPQVLSIGQSVTLQGSLPTNDVLQPTCANANAGETVIPVSIQANGLLTATLQGELEGTLGEPVLSLRRDCLLSQTELACAAGQTDPKNPLQKLLNPSIIRVPVTPGDYALILDGVKAGDAADYSLTLNLASLGNAPANERCNNAAVLETGTGGASFALNLNRAMDDFAALGGANSKSAAPEAVYALSLPAGHLKVQLEANFAVGAALVNDCGQTPLAQGFGFETNVEAGEYFLVVEGGDANARGTVAASIVFNEMPAAPANDTCATATPISLGETVESTTWGSIDDYSRFTRGNRCTGSDNRGGDVVYVLNLAAGEEATVTATPTSGWDLSLYAVTDCASLLDTCESGSDGEDLRNAGMAETIQLNNQGTYYIIVDGTHGESGSFELSVRERRN